MENKLNYSTPKDDRDNILSSRIYLNEQSIKKLFQRHVELEKIVAKQSEEIASLLYLINDTHSKKETFFDTLDDKNLLAASKDLDNRYSKYKDQKQKEDQKQKDLDRTFNTFSYME